MFNSLCSGPLLSREWRKIWFRSWFQWKLWREFFCLVYHINSFLCLMLSTTGLSIWTWEWMNGRERGINNMQFRSFFENVLFVYQWNQIFTFFKPKPCGHWHVEKTPCGTGHWGYICKNPVFLTILTTP